MIGINRVSCGKTPVAAIQDLAEVEFFGDGPYALPEPGQTVKMTVDGEVLAYSEPLWKVDIRRGEVHAIQQAIAMQQHILAQYADAACRRQQQTEQHGERGSLAGAVTSQ